MKIKFKTCKQQHESRITEIEEIQNETSFWVNGKWRQNESSFFFFWGEIKKFTCTSIGDSGKWYSPSDP